MRAWTFALALIFLVAAPAPSRPAEPAGATIMLRLPPSMSADAVRGLIADLVAKGVRPEAGAHDPASPASVTTGELAARIWKATSRAVRESTRAPDAAALDRSGRSRGRYRRLGPA